MRFAKYVFIGAAIWGVAVLTPFYWLVDVTGRRYDPPTAYPHFFYGFLAVALAWQIAFLVIGSNPARFRRCDGRWPEPERQSTPTAGSLRSVPALTSSPRR